MTKEIWLKCRHCKVLHIKKDVLPEICPVCSHSDWRLVPLRIKKGDMLVGTIEHGTDGLITFFPEKNIPWNIKQLARLIKDMAEYD